ncbi:hypothetical protein ABPG72_017170 [Tetrahymena utriculariae]
MTLIQGLFFNKDYQSFVEEQDVEKKTQYYKQHLELNPNSNNAINNLGLICEKQDKKQETLNLFKQAFQNNKENISYSSNIQIMLYDLKFYDKLQNNVRQLLNQAKSIQDRIEQKETYIVKEKRLAHEYFELNNKKEALKYYQKNIEFYPNSPKSLHRIGLLQISLNNNKNEAIKYFQKSIQAKPSNNAQAYKELGLLQIQRQQYTLVKQNLMKAKEQDQQNKSQHLNLSRNEKKYLKHMKQSIIYFEDFIKFCQNNQDEKFNLIEMYFNEQEYAKLRQFIKQLIKDSSENYKIYFEYGRLEYREENYYQAIAYYEMDLKKKQIKLLFLLIQDYAIKIYKNIKRLSNITQSIINQKKQVVEGIFYWQSRALKFQQPEKSYFN